MDLVNIGHNVHVDLHDEVTDLYKLSGGGLPTTYTATSFHFHWGSINSQGSEHLFDGTSYPAEMQMIHYDKSKYANISAALAGSQWDAITILVVMIEVGEHNTAFDSVLSHISQVANYSSGNTSLGQGNLPSFPIRNVLPSDLSKFYRYNGSKALPDCNEAIIWTIFTDTISISQAQSPIVRTRPLTSCFGWVEVYKLLFQIFFSDFYLSKEFYISSFEELDTFRTLYGDRDESQNRRQLPPHPTAEWPHNLLQQCSYHLTNEGIVYHGTCT
ncbi:carbonic anhydrase 1-like [Strongylocentrotus purpuratus]|uniref:Alpha-carbonic anhydrase domain-containing protein n=1 Tax=Strongylocentrotus purpuratus TaxID=7668 RepID=A0A7M7N3C9_STRPU|nr:carbonic anhydrase 1-like [Strongylocentrotus purpuratus]